MVKITCKCGKSEVIFQHLSDKDFPNGLEQDCCHAMPNAIDDSVPEHIVISEEVPTGDPVGLERVTDDMPITKGRKSKRK